MRINRARQLARESLSEVRRSVRALRPQALEAGDLAHALVSLTKRMTQDTSVEVNFQVSGISVLLPPSVEDNLLRIVQEALTNILKHAHATSAWIELAYKFQEIYLSIRDDGQGFDLNSYRAKNSEKDSFGLVSMHERVEQMGGRLTIATSLGQGTNLSVTLPIQNTMPHDYKRSHD